MQAVLVMFRSDGERRSFSIARDMTVIGRREDCDLRIPLGEVSRKHCRLIRDGDSLKLEDLGSSNGTFLNGSRVQEALLSPGDTIQVGPVVFVVQVDGEPADEELRPVTMDAAQNDDAVPLDDALGDEDAPTLEPSALEGDAEDSAVPAMAHRKGNGAGNGTGNGAGHHEDLDLGELQPMGDSEDAAFDALTADNDQPLEELEIDLDAEEQSTPPPPPR
jgi:pSer/pThr/pTyr-binding forkhead associated (FHA) protein